MLLFGLICAAILVYLLDNKMTAEARLRLIVAEKEHEIVVLSAGNSAMRALLPTPKGLPPAPIRDGWVDHQFRLIELARVGYPGAISSMHGNLVDFIRMFDHRASYATQEVENWTRMKLLVERLSCEEMDDDGFTVRDDIDSWIEEAEEYLSVDFSTEERLALVHVLQIDDDDRMELFERVHERLGLLLRLPRKDYAALSMNRQEFIDYLQHIGYYDDETLAKYDAAVGPKTSSPAPIQATPLPPPNETAASPAMVQIEVAITSVEAAIKRLPEDSRGPYEQRLTKLRNYREKLVAKATASQLATEIEKIEAQLSEAEILAETAVDVSEMA